MVEPDFIDVIIVGAGAAGLWASIETAKAGLNTVLVEKTRRTGTKILASGGTRCNLTTTLDKRSAAQLFGPQAATFLGPAFAALPPKAVRERFAQMGVPTKTEPALEKVFPKSDRASDVRDALERTARQAGVQILTSRPVTHIEPRDSGWRVNTTKGELRGKALMLCSGGKSYPKTGTTGDGYPWLRSLGLKVVDPVPALVPVVSTQQWVRDLTGISLDAEARIGKKRRRRPTLFTHLGLSGPAPMDLSVHVARASGPVTMNLDLLPDETHDSLRATFHEAAHRKGAASLVRLIPLQKRLAQAVLSVAGIAKTQAPSQLSKRARQKLIETLKGLPVTLTGTVGFHKAEVTAGGLSLQALDRKTMQVHGQPGLFVVGELLDLTGPIGGLNFQAAFATAHVGAAGVIRYLSPEKTNR